MGRASRGGDQSEQSPRLRKGCAFETEVRGRSVKDEIDEMGSLRFCQHMID
jgi:hypothetical protein